MAQTTIATAADYADAMLTARRAKNWLFALLLAVLLGQLALFLVTRFTKVLENVVVAPSVVGGGSATASHASAAEAGETVAAPSTAPADASSTSVSAESSTVTIPAARKPLLSAPQPTIEFRTRVLQYTVGLTGFLGITLSIVLALVLLLIVSIMLIGRLIGVSHVTSALIWCFVLIVFLFPWQAFLNNQDLTAPDFKIPGVLYTWDELTNKEWYHDRDGWAQFRKWSRFVAFPFAAIILLLVINSRSRRGLRLALGEAELEGTTIETEESSPT